LGTGNGRQAQDGEDGYGGGERALHRRGSFPR
jgi:hypothetical protein